MKKIIIIIVIFILTIITVLVLGCRQGKVLSSTVNYTISKITNGKYYIVDSKSNNTVEYLAFVNVVLRESRFKNNQHILLILNNDTIVLKREKILKAELLYQDVNFKASKGMFSKVYPNDSLNDHIQNAIFITEKNRHLEKVQPFKISNFIEVLPTNNSKTIY